MSAAASKNSVVVGFVAYFVGLSLMGLLIYRWSQPHLAMTAPSNAHASVEAHEGTGAVVEYENIAGQEVAAPVTSAPVTGAEANPAAPNPAAKGEAAKAAGDEWN
ncbi:MAG: hypothetical protein ABIR96_09260 [Bdellovibrionota bacterium]